jgi:RNA polymerase sigma factor (sigma-70 family)
MDAERERSFLNDVNQNIRIVHQVCRIYFWRDPAEREDLFQDIMYQLWRSYPLFKGESKPSTWIYKVALNTAITTMRRTSRAKQNAGSMQPAEATSPMTDPLARKEEVDSLYSAIDELAPLDKAIILLHLEDRSYDEIAAITGLTIANVSVRLVRIRRALKERIQKA